MQVGWGKKLTRGWKLIPLRDGPDRDTNVPIYVGTSDKDAQLIMNQAAELGRLANTLTEVADWLDNGRTKTGINARQKAVELREMVARVRSMLAAPPAMPSVEIARLKRFIHAIYEEDSGLTVWDPGYDGGKYADLANDARAVHEATLETQDGS